MSHTMRWRYGETNSVVMPAATGVTIEIGDLVYSDGGSLRPATDLADQGTPAQNQEAFHDSFVGVAMQCTAGVSGESIRVATSGVFEYTCDPASFNVGDLVGCAEDGTGTALQSQTVIGVATEDLALGRCVKHAAAGSERVLVDIVSTIVRGGPQAAA